ncbi:unnamed protein product [Ranitomeya imitator]|uniref:ribonuclease H n=1 Tax=Ranitomeya imitator TaxID=111125 RepID=A0ABN9MJP6_9NEOB|nr:unnamed protein product [Ranitomeya imitator]
MKVPKVDAAVASTSKAGALPLEDVGLLKDPSDRKADMYLKKVWESTAGAFKPAISSTCTARSVMVWISQLEEQLKSKVPRDKMLNFLSQIREGGIPSGDASNTEDLTTTETGNQQTRKRKVRTLMPHHLPQEEEEIIASKDLPVGGRCYMTVLDLKDAYYHLPIHQDHQQFLRMAVRLNDQDLGWIVNMEKSRLEPSTTQTFLGILLNSEEQQCFLPEDKKQRIVHKVSTVTRKPDLTLRDAMSLLGSQTSCIPAVQWAQFHTRVLQAQVLDAERSLQGQLGGRLRLSTATLHSLRWWLNRRHLEKGVRWSVVPDNTVTTDASPIGWGAHIGDVWTQGQWSLLEAQESSNWKELTAVKKALLRLLPSLQDSHVRVQTDNTTVVAYLNHQGSTRSRSLMNTATDILKVAEAHFCSLSAVHIRGELNAEADYLSCHSLRQGEWVLNRRVFNQIVDLWGLPVIDLFATRENRQTRKFASLQTFVLTPRRKLPEEQLALETEVLGLVLKKVLVEVPREEKGEGFYSPLFLIRKPDGSLRTIVNLRKLNRSVINYSFKMESVSSAIKMLFPDCFMAAIDLKDAYYHVPIHRDYQKFLRVAVFVQGQLKHYQYAALPFGLSIAPRIFTKLMSEVMSFLRSRNIVIVPYLDDFLVIGRSVDHCLAQIEEVTTTLAVLGWEINVAKSRLTPEKVQSFLGLVLDSTRQLSPAGEQNIQNTKSCGNGDTSACDDTKKGDVPAREGGEVLLVRPEGEPGCSRCPPNTVGIQPRLRVSTNSINSGSGKEDQDGASKSDSDCSILAEETIVFYPKANVGNRSMDPTGGSGPAYPGSSMPLSSEGLPSGSLEFERTLLSRQGFSSGLISTLLRSRKPIISRIYGRTWKRFLEFLGQPLSDEAPVGAILEFLQAGLQLGLATNTLKVQVSALGALYHCNLASNKSPKAKSVRRSTLSPSATNSLPCILCGRRDDCTEKYGEKKTYVEHKLTLHYYCLLLSSGIWQRGEEDEGIYGFLIDDIKREVNRARKLKCHVCKRNGASIGCVFPRCKRGYHFPCGIEKQCIFQFMDTFRSYCWEHRPVQKALSRQSNGSSPCTICLENVDHVPSYHVIRGPCCKTSWYHRDCLQHQALSAGLFFFRCTVCNNKEKFQKEMLCMGIHIPERYGINLQSDGLLNLPDARNERPALWVSFLSSAALLNLETLLQLLHPVKPSPDPRWPRIRVLQGGEVASQSLLKAGTVKQPALLSDR